MVLTSQSSVVNNVPSAARLDRTTVRVEINVANCFLHSKFIASQITGICVNNVDKIGVGDIQTGVCLI